MALRRENISNTLCNRSPPQFCRSPNPASSPEERTTLNEQIDLLREMRDLLRVMAEPAIAKRDEKLRARLRDAVGKSRLAAKAVLLMDGARSQSVLCKEAGIDQGNLSKLVKSLRAQGLLANDDKHPKLVIAIPPDFFEHEK